MQYLILFGFESPALLVVIVAAVLLFGAGKLPQLAKALGQSKRSFKEGLEEAEGKGQEQQKKAVEVLGESKPSLESIDDEALFAEAHRRAGLQGSEKER